MSLFLMIISQWKLAVLVVSGCQSGGDIGIMGNLCIWKLEKLSETSRKGAPSFSQLSEVLPRNQEALFLLCLHLSSWNCSCTESNSANISWRPAARCTSWRKAIHFSSKYIMAEEIELWVADPYRMTFRILDLGSISQHASRYNKNDSVNKYIWGKIKWSWMGFSSKLELPEGDSVAAFPKFIWPWMTDQLIDFYFYFVEHVRELVFLG